MRIKLGVLFLFAVIVVASAGMGISYTSNGLSIEGVPSGWCDVAFTSVAPGVPPDNEDGTDVGDVTVTLDPSGSSITVVITTAYPGYEAYVDFTITNIGNKPIDVNGVVGQSYDTTALAIQVSGVEAGTVLGVGESIDGTATIRVLPGAAQGTVYPFTVSLGFSNEEYPQYTFVETVVVNADDPNPTMSIASLSDTVEYTLVATGTAWKFFDYYPDSIEFDAKYSISYGYPSDTWTDLVTGWENYGTMYLDLFVNGNPGAWGDYNDDHTYECTITGDGSPVALWIYDIVELYPYNTGSLTVDIYETS